MQGMCQEGEVWSAIEDKEMKWYPRTVNKPHLCEGCKKYIEKGKKSIYTNYSYSGINYKIHAHNEKCASVFEKKNVGMKL